MKIKMNKKELIALIILILLPFCIIIIAVYPYTDGVSGTNYANADNNYEFDGIIFGDAPDGDDGTYEGRFRGDLFIEGGTGWIVCNGKVRYAGEVHIKNTVIDYYVEESEHSGSFIDFDEQVIEIHGDEGEMEEGIPFYYLGFLGSGVGLILWFSYVITKRRTILNKATFLVGSFFALLSITAIVFSFCMAFLIVPLALFFILYKGYKELFPSPYGEFIPPPRKEFAVYPFSVGIVILICSALSYAIPPLGNRGPYYSYSAGLGFVFFGLMGAFSSAILLGFSMNEFLNPIDMDEFYESKIAPQYKYYEKRSEQVGDSQRSNAKLGEQERMKDSETTNRAP